VSLYLAIQTFSLSLLKKCYSPWPCWFSTNFSLTSRRTAYNPSKTRLEDQLLQPVNQPATWLILAVFSSSAAG